FWLERGLNGDAIDGAFDSRHATRRKLSTGVLWQDEKGPRIGLFALRWPEEFRFETDRGFRHLPSVVDRIALFWTVCVSLTHKVKLHFTMAAKSDITHRTFVRWFHGWLDPITSPCEVLTQKG